MNDFVLNGYIISGFLFVFAVIQLWVATQLAPVKDEHRVSLRRMFSVRHFLFLFGAFYLFLCFLFLYVTLGSSLFLSLDAPCQLLINSSSSSGGIVTYQYTDSCASTVVPSSVERLYVILSYLLMLQMVIAVLAVLIAIMRWMLKW